MHETAVTAQAVTLRDDGVLIERLDVPHREIADYLLSLPEDQRVFWSRTTSTGASGSTTLGRQGRGAVVSLTSENLPGARSRPPPGQGPAPARA